MSIWSSDSAKATRKGGHAKGLAQHSVGKILNTRKRKLRATIEYRARYWLLCIVMTCENNMHVHVYVYMHVHVYVYMHACMCTCTCGHEENTLERTACNMHVHVYVYMCTLHV